MARAALALGVLLLLAGCGGAPRATNAAVQACQEQADDQGLDNVEQQTVTPLGGGRYAVILDVVKDNSDVYRRCDYDPHGGAHLRKASN